MAIDSLGSLWYNGVVENTSAPTTGASKERRSCMVKKLVRLEGGEIYVTPDEGDDVMIATKSGQRILMSLRDFGRLIMAEGVEVEDISSKKGD